MTKFIKTPATPKEIRDAVINLLYGTAAILNNLEMYSDVIQMSRKTAHEVFWKFQHSAPCWLRK